MKEKVSLSRLFLTNVSKLPMRFQKSSISRSNAGKSGFELTGSNNNFVPPKKTPSVIPWSDSSQKISSRP